MTSSGKSRRYFRNQADGNADDAWFGTDYGPPQTDIVNAVTEIATIVIRITSAM